MLSIFLCLLVVAAVGVRPALAQSVPSQNLVKAEFVERFTRFIDWPRDKLEPGDRFTLCVLGITPVGTPLAQVARRRFKNREVSYVRLGDLDRIASCHLVFIASSERGRLAEILKRARGRPILTIGDTEGYCERGVLINLYPAGRNLHFEINIEAALESGLRFRSKLLRLARLVRGDGGGAP